MVAAKSFSEWYAFFGGEEMNIGRDNAAVVWEAAVSTMAKSRTSTNKRRNAICRWKYVEDGYWHTSCGEDFVFNDGTPQENGVVYCFHCGKRASVR